MRLRLDGQLSMKQCQLYIGRVEQLLAPMRTYQIASIPGDGIGKEVIPAGQKALEALSQNGAAGFKFNFEYFDWGGDHIIITNR